MTRGIVLAAGMGRRMGLPKALLALRGETFFARALRTFETAGLPVISVVNDVVEREIEPPSSSEIRLVNPNPDEGGMFGSVRLAANEALRSGAESVVLLPVDLPLVTAEDVRRVAGALAGESSVAVATHNGARGHPVGIGRAVLREIVVRTDATSLRDIIRSNPDRVVTVETSLGAVLGANTREELAVLESRMGLVN